MRWRLSWRALTYNDGSRIRVAVQYSISVSSCKTLCQVEANANYPYHINIDHLRQRVALWIIPFM